MSSFAGPTYPPYHLSQIGSVSGVIGAARSPGPYGYSDLRSTADRFELGEFHIWVASIDDLMRMKRAAGRPKDLIELEVLGALRDELES